MRGTTSLVIALTCACNYHDHAAPIADGDVAADGAIDTPEPPPPELPALAICTVANPGNVRAAFVPTASGDAISYACATPCAGDWTTCAFGFTNQGQPVMSARGDQMQALAFVVDGMAGHFVFTPDGNDVVVTHAGSGGISVFNPFDLKLQATSDLKTVSLGWDRGSTAIFGGAGWFTRKDANGTTVRAQVARPAAAIQWVKDHMAVGHKLGTVGSSMGTIATFGAHVWYGLEPIIDYQMLIGGPGFWDVNAGCGRVHIPGGHCDVDVAPCAGNPNSSFGDDDPTCGTATNNCRVPTVMAPRPTGSEYDACINYVGATTACAPSAADNRDASLDASSLASTVTSWSFHGRIDIVANEGGQQPPNADQGMGLGHMMYLYESIESSKGWIDNEGAHHGDAWDLDQSLMARAAAIVVAGMQ